MSAALARADEVFEKRLARLEPLCIECDGKLEPFETAVRAYRAKRLELPVATLWDEDAGHGSAMVHQNLRRLAWFIPSFLSAAREHPGEPLTKLASLLDEAHEGERRRRPDAPRDLTALEREALGDFLLALARLRSDIGAHEAILLVARAARIDLAPLLAVIRSA